MDTQIENPNSLDNLVGMVRGLATRMDSMAQHATPPKPKGVCYAFQKGRCERQNCPFAHEDAQGRQSPGPAYQPPTQRPRYEQVGNSQQQQQRQQSQQQQQDCNDFKRGLCTRSNCRFLHGTAGGNQTPNNSNNYSNGRGNQQPNNSNNYSNGGGNRQPNNNSSYNNGGETTFKREHRPDNRSEAPQPPKSCNRMWNESSCNNPNCTWEHGNCAEPGTAGICNGFRDRKHCYFIFTPVGCRFTHSGPTTRTASGSNAVPMGNTIPQQRAPPPPNDASSGAAPTKH